MTQPLLALDGLTMRFGGVTAVSDVSFAVAHKEVVGVIGPNGAGKTTLFNLLSGAMKPVAGEVRLHGKAINALGPHQRARLGIGRTFQIARPFLTMTALENVMVGSFMKARAMRRAVAHAMVVLDEVKLADRAGRQAGELSLSEQRRLEVARALALGPEIILLDEVMAGLNLTEIGATIEMFQALHRRGLTFLVIEHNLKVIRALSERVVVLDHGVMIAEGRPDHILNLPEVVEAYLGRRRH
jgi:branched-chain amino acid transport system ATP-binding protein